MSGQHCENYHVTRETVTREMLTASIRDQSVQLFVIWLIVFHRFDPFFAT